MKKLLLSTLAVASLFATTNEELLKQIEALKAKINQLEKQVQTNKKTAEESKKIAITARDKVNPLAANDHLYWSAELRSSIDYIHEKTNDGKVYANNILYNKVNLAAMAKPSDNLKFNLELQVNNIYGMNSVNNQSQYNNISWVANETPDDTNVRLKEAYFNYWFGEDNGYMFSAGRRPATEGFPANLRENERAKSPIAHLVNMEFDGFSFLITNTAMSNWYDKFGDWGTSIKFCAGRGYSSANGKWPSDGSPSYSKDNLGMTDFGGFIIIPYDDGQYAVWTETIFAKNMKGYSSKDLNNDGKYNDLDDLGDYFGFNLLLKAAGIGDGISDFLDDTTAFISFATSKTSPDSGKQMLGTTDSKRGYSIWIGADMPGLKDDDRFGFNLVKGSKYWRSMTYGEDTLEGSIAAVRGKAYEIYYNAQIIPHLSAGLRATIFDYDYAGSDAFFGIYGNPDQKTYVDKAEDIRAYIRYKF